MVYQAIKALVQYGLEKGLLTEDDAIYARNHRYSTPRAR